jgi:DNA polymerase I-like protein with 3'-5' exonuclease and polymerase domains
MIYFVTNRNSNQYQISDERIEIIDEQKGQMFYQELIKIDKVLALDFEASGLEIFQLTPLLLAIGTKATQLVIDCTTVNVLNVIDKRIEDTEILGHNIKYDLKILKVHYNIHLKKVYDTMNVERKIYQGAGKSVDNPFGMLFGLADVTQRRLKYLPETMSTKEESRERFIGQTKSSYIPIDQDIIYAASDVTYLHDIKAAQEQDIERFNLGFYINQISNPLNLTVADCELRGFTFDIVSWKELIVKNKNKQFEKACVLDELLIKYRDEFLQGEDRLLLVGGEYTRKRVRHPEANKIGLFGDEVIDKDYYGKASKPKFNTGNINWDSSEQVVDVCARLKIPLPINDKKIGAAVPRLIKHKDRKGGLTVKIDKGNYTFTTDKQELALMVSENPKLPAKDFYLTLSEYRKYSHYISSFGENYIDKVNPITGRIHTLFRTENSETGRFQSGGGRKNPEYYNAQNIPRDGDFRHCFIATPGYSITTCDLSGK